VQQQIRSSACSTWKGNAWCKFPIAASYSEHPWFLLDRVRGFGSLRSDLVAACSLPHLVASGCALEAQSYRQRLVAM